MKTGATRPNDPENLIAEAHSKIDSLYGKDTLENYKINSRKSLLFPSCDCPLEVLCDIFTKKIFLVFI